jgi:iron complex outermembrane recepter protein
MTDHLELAGGARYTYEEKNITAENTYVNPLVGPLFNLRPAGLPQMLGFRGHNVSPEATLSWTPREGTLIYAAYKTGYKSGGASNPSRLSANTPDADLIYGPEKSKGGEIGVKTYLADRTVRVEATAYSYLYGDLQVSSFDVTANNGTGASRITNAASARIKGIEFSGEWRPVAGLRLTGQAVYNIAKFKAFPNATCYTGQPVGGASSCQPIFRPNPANPGAPILAGTRQDLAGSPLTRAPKWALMFGGSYDTAVTSDLTFGIDANANRTSGYFTQDDYNPDSFQRGFWLLNGGLRLSSEHSGWEIGLVGRNLANRYYRKVCGAKFIANQYQCGNIRAREVTLQLGYKF